MKNTSKGLSVNSDFILTNTSRKGGGGGGEESNPCSCDEGKKNVLL